MKSNAIFQTDSTDDCINLKGKRKKRETITITEPVFFTVSFGFHAENKITTVQYEWYFDSILVKPSLQI